MTVLSSLPRTFACRRHSEFAVYSLDSLRTVPPSYFIQLIGRNFDILRPSHSVRRRDTVLEVAIPRSITSGAAHLGDRTRRHIALRLLPFLFILYVTNYLDRTSVAYAAIGMSRDLGFSDRVFGLGAGIFFAGYVALQIPGGLLVERWSARRMISTTMIAWGSLTALTGFVHTPAQLYLARFVLGAAEAGFFPGVIVYLSHWFLRDDRAKATSNFIAAIPISFVIGSPIAGWILGRNWLAIEGWRWLFILEGTPAILFGIVAFFYLTDLPTEATWLAVEQRAWIQGKVDEEKFVRTQSLSIARALRSRPILLLATVCFLNYFVIYCLIFWFPTMLKRHSGFSDLNVGLLGALPYVVAFFAMQINGWHSDKTQERHWHSAAPFLIATAGLLGLLLHPHSIPLSILFFTMVGMCIICLPTFWTIPTEILGQSAAAAAVGMINAIGSVAGFAGPYLFGYLNTRTGSFSYGLIAMMASSLAGVLLMLSISKGVSSREVLNQSASKVLGHITKPRKHN
jgi:MFS transporter, ACS family, tartrate transporter